MAGNANYATDIIASTLENFVSKQPADAIWEDNALFDLLKMRAKVVTDGGRVLLEPVNRAGNTTVSSYRDYDLIDISPQEHLTNAEFEWAEYAGSVTISEREEDINNGKSAVIKMLSNKWDNLRSALDDTLNADLFGNGTGNDGKAALGLALMIDSAGTFGNIIRASNSYWSAQETPVTGPLVVAGSTGMRRMWNDCSNGKSKRVPNALITTQDIFEDYEDLMAPYMRYSVTGEANAVFSSDNLMFRKAPLTWDGDCTSGVMYFLNTKYMKFVFHSNRQFKVHPFVRPANQTARVALISVMFQLIANNPRHLGKLTGIT